MTTITYESTFRKVHAVIDRLRADNAAVILPDDHPMRARAVLGKAMGLLWLQGRPSHEAGQCRYRMLDAGGNTLRCGVGMLIEYDHYNEVFEGQGVDNTILSPLYEALVHSRVCQAAIEPPVQRVLSAVQYVHDRHVRAPSLRKAIVDWPVDTLDTPLQGGDLRGTPGMLDHARHVYPWAHAMHQILYPDGEPANEETQEQARRFVIAVASLSHLLLQAQQSMVIGGKTGAKTCCYTAPDGRHCAVGVLIRPGLPGNMPGDHPSNRANISVSGLTSSFHCDEGREELLESLKESGLPVDQPGLDLLQLLQRIHDNVEHQTPANLLEEAVHTARGIGRGAARDTVYRALLWLIDPITPVFPTDTTQEA